MKKNGFASIYMVYSFFLIFILMMMTVLMINNYKKTFLNSLKNDIKAELQDKKLDKTTFDTLKNEENPK